MDVTVITKFVAVRPKTYAVEMQKDEYENISSDHKKV